MKVIACAMPMLLCVNPECCNLSGWWATVFETMCVPILLLFSDGVAFTPYCNSYLDGLREFLFGGHDGYED